MINQLLNELGFSDKEIKVYLAILKNGKVIPAHLAKMTGINRTTIYAIAKELIDRGVIGEDLGTYPTQLVASSPNDLKNIIKKGKKQLENTQTLVDKTIIELETFAQSVKYSIPKIIFIEEERIEDYLYKQTPIWNESLKEVDPTWWGFQDPSFVTHYQDWIDWYWQKANPKTINLKLLTSQAAVEDVMKQKNYQRRQIKYWKEASNFTATTWVNGDYIIMIMTSAKPHYLVEIHDKILANNMRNLFKGIWNSIS